MSDGLIPRWAVGVETETLYSSPRIRIGRWQCVVGSRKSTAEQRQRWHMLSFLHGGSFYVEAYDRRSLIDSSCALLIDPAKTYHMSRHNGERSNGSYFLVDPTSAAEAMATHGATSCRDESRPFTEIRGPVSTKAYLLQRLVIKRLLEPGDIDPLEVEEIALHLFDTVFHYQEGKPRSRPTPQDNVSARSRYEIVEKVRDFLGQSIGEPISLAEIASFARISPYHLCRLFKSETGVSLHRYRTRLRLRAVLDQIVDGADDLASLAMTFGFSSHSHLSAAFRSEYGASPSDIRMTAGKPRLRTLSRQVALAESL